MALTFKIGRYDEGSTVTVTFTDGDIVHTREVNIVTDENGKYDKAATKERVKEVALGVAHKISVGAIKAEPIEDISE